MSLDIVLGPMFAGKSSYILGLVLRYSAIGTPVMVIKHSSDTRYVYGEDNIVTHDQRRATCASVQYLGQVVLRDRIKDHSVIIVDEAQFFPELVEFVTYVVEELGKKLYLVGLDGDIHRKPFGEILECIPLADRIEKLTSFCHSCADGTPGLFSYRSQGPMDQQVLIGGQDMYQSLCRACYLRRNKEESRA
jgi:thymidine kinase